MVKKKKHSHKKASSSPKHVLPDGFWSQVIAVLLIAISILFVVAWFNAGGPVIEVINNSLIFLIGNAVYLLPILFIYVAVMIFKADDNRLPLVMKLAICFEIVWFSAFFGLFKQGDGQASAGGIIGDLVNQGVLQLVIPNVAMFIYILLIFTTLLFIIRVTPIAIVRGFWRLVHRDTSEEDEVERVINRANEASGFTVTGNVPMVEQDIDDSPKVHGIRRPGHIISAQANTEKPAVEKAALVTVSDPNWVAPDMGLLESKQTPANPGSIKKNAAIIKDTLREFDIDVDMAGANVGPRVTRFKLRPPTGSGIKLSRITALETNLALNLAASNLRIEAPIPGQSAVGIEVPNKTAADVRIRSILSSAPWRSSKETLAFAIGQDIGGAEVIGELNRMPHLLIAGQTGSGKSVMINTLLISLLYRNSPSDLKLILVDPKTVEMNFYNDIPHLLTPVINDVDKTISALKWAVNEMERRFKLLNENNSRDIKTYNEKMRQAAQVSTADDDVESSKSEKRAMPYIVIVIDELADFMMSAGRDMEALIARLSAKARAVGIHLVLATQTPRADIITGKIKANIPARIAFTVASQLESRIILDQGGAEKLLGLGDMLYVTAIDPKPCRIQGAWVTDDEIVKVVAHLRLQSDPEYNDDVINQKVHLNGSGGLVPDHESGSGEDPLFDEAVQLVVNTQKASASSLQRRFKLGYNRAARLIDYMEERGIVGPSEGGSRPREVLIDSIDDINGADDVDESDDL